VLDREYGRTNGKEQIEGDEIPNSNTFIDL
jgi:hypothetical protein